MVLHGDLAGRDVPFAGHAECQHNSDPGVCAYFSWARAGPQGRKLSLGTTRKKRRSFGVEGLLLLLLLLFGGGRGGHHLPLTLSI